MPGRRAPRAYNKEEMASHSRAWACRCGAHLMLTFTAVPARAGEPDAQFTCPACGTIRTVPAKPGARVHSDSLKVRRA